MNNKNKINRIAGIASLFIGVIIVLGSLVGKDSILGFPNAYLLYALMPMVIVWFGTRKNACGSCNQSHSFSNTDLAAKSKNHFSN